jgi:hypothetical protein
MTKRELVEMIECPRCGEVIEIEVAGHTCPLVTPVSLVAVDKDGSLSLDLRLTGEQLETLGALLASGAYPGVFLG